MNEPRMGFILFIVNFNDLEWDGGGGGEEWLCIREEEAEDKM